MHTGIPFSGYGVLFLGMAGIGLAYLALRTNGGRRRVGRHAQRELDRLLAEIGRGIRMLGSPSQFPGVALLREKQYEVARQLGELQTRLSQLDDPTREQYEQRAHRVLEMAAKCGITVPPP